MKKLWLSCLLIVGCVGALGANPPLELPAALTVAGDRVTVKFATPGTGSYTVKTSQDLHAWTIAGAGFNAKAVNVAVHFPASRLGFYRVQFSSGPTQ